MIITDRAKAVSLSPPLLYVRRVCTFNEFMYDLFNVCVCLYVYERFAWEVGVCFVLRNLFESFLL